MPLSTMPDPLSEQVIVLRTAMPEAAVVPTVRRVLQGLDSSAALFNIHPMHEVLTGSYSVSYTRTLSLLLSAFASLALFIAAFGLYGVMSYIVTERLREVAVRLAVGASRVQISQFVLRQSVPLLVAGLILGTGGAFLASRGLESLLFGLHGVSPFTLFVSVSILTLAAAIGIAVPAFRATRVDPIQLLRQE
jgi:putative ABC transport system permease protein